MTRAAATADVRLTHTDYRLFHFHTSDPVAEAREELAREFRIMNRVRASTGRIELATRWALSRANRRLWAAQNYSAIKHAANIY